MTDKDRIRVVFEMNVKGQVIKRDANQTEQKAFDEWLREGRFPSMVGVEMDFKIKCLTQDAGEAEQKAFYQALLKVNWLAPAVRGIIMKTLGLSLREYNHNLDMGRDSFLSYAVKERKAALKQSGVKNFHVAALKEIASLDGITIEALQKRIKRLPKVMR